MGKDIIARENSQEFRIMNIDRWHELGYKGQGTRGGNVERCSPDHPLFNGKVHYNIGRVYDEVYDNGHGNKTMLIIHGIAPEAELEILDDRKSSTESHLITKTYPLAREKGVTVINASRSTIDASPRATREIRDMKKNYNLKPVISAGNLGKSGTSSDGRGEWIMCGAASVGYSDDDLYRATWSGVGKSVDFVTLFISRFPDFRKYSDGRILRGSGTSYSAPVLAGIMLLIDGFFIEKTGKPLTFDAMYQFLVDHSMDLGKKGKDEEFGHGLIVLPEPDSIDIAKYTDAKIKDKPEAETGGNKTAKSFPDVLEDKWYFDAIDFCIKEGYMKGYDDGTFKPDRMVRRSELVTVMKNLDKRLKKKLPVKQNFDINKFEDVEIVNWFGPSIKYCMDRNIVNGYKENGKLYFKPEREVKRVEACQIFKNLDDNLNIKADNKTKIDVRRYADMQDKKWYDEAVQYCLHSGYILGYTNSGKRFFRPQRGLKRSELAELIYNRFK